MTKQADIENIIKYLSESTLEELKNNNRVYYGSILWHKAFDEVFCKTTRTKKTMEAFTLTLDFLAKSPAL